MKKTSLIIIAVLIILIIAVGIFFLKKPAFAGNQSFTPTKLAQFDGSDPAKPIYLGLDGLVYDVTTGKEYYDLQGRYHFLAGKDSSELLHLAGAGIIKVKYPVIGKLAP